MKKILIAILLFLPLVMMAQTDPVLSIDGVNTIFKSGLSLPYWLKSGQTVSLVSGVKSASIIEFTEDNGNLKYSQTIALTSSQTVPTGKVWKIEGLGLGNNGITISGFSNNVMPTIFTSPITFSSPGDYDWKVPPNVSNICVELWGPGGAGLPSGSGGGGGYGYQCLNVIPNSIHTIHIGSVWGGDSTIFDGLFFASGGGNPTLSSNGLLGLGGTSNCYYYLTGASGTQNGAGYFGGSGANGGSGGGPCGPYCNQNGQFPGGGGGNGYIGASGQVKIYW